MSVKVWPPNHLSILLWNEPLCNFFIALPKPLIHCWVITKPCGPLNIMIARGSDLTSYLQSPIFDLERQLLYLNTMSDNFTLILLLRIFAQSTFGDSFPLPKTKSFQFCQKYGFFTKRINIWTRIVNQRVPELLKF